MAFLFASEAGTPMDHHNYLLRRLKPIAKSAGIARVDHRILRRTVATHMQDHGPVRAAQGLLRHASAATTMNHYQKQIDSNVAAAQQSWDTIIFRAPGTL